MFLDDASGSVVDENGPRGRGIPRIELVDESDTGGDEERQLIGKFSEAEKEGSAEVSRVSGFQ